ncbi:glycoprotein 3-alpha-L-fucosyltransferase A-like [Dreissena polymorpha]|uniref:glycoprotein 3-alpha-L-fucosyltransferase A-like n=1 Tax=Dreissena polymorpha TaxID=45954 RepID=UPI0022645E9D|nr:glycoprotein 3-alpha-L-fucosyltransferase A-like [Dreissena polymorpha]XP_052212481.1 glycoprotein 3-alpha-L-fucosyltransferase A-like [Dreissena polymorpha]XP_052212486.1 glycoprotein 3-alpha-L-fucosyltransferase A-like [Dreissena polymorpha]XP_052212491.1 glycoprotein 3-alpha-L-fucosyltransferase A-like [Dreissena polymorpha]
MRFHLKKTVIWTLTGFCFVFLTLNIYNQGILQPRIKLAPLWGENVDVITHVFQRDNIGRNVTNGTAVVAAREARFNVTLDEKKLAGPLSGYSLSSDTKQHPSMLDKQVVWPDKNFYENDRIVNQLKHQPDWVAKAGESKEEIPLKKILLFSSLSNWSLKRGRQTFIDQKCTVNTCEVTDSRDAATNADAVLFQSPQASWPNRPPNQVWILFMLESPYHTPGLFPYANQFNWTATYRHDSDIVAPYEKFVPFNENVQTIPQNKSYAAGKTKKVAWFVSNCGARNTRLEYAKELGKYIDVDIYGACGSLQCLRSETKCYDMLNSDYKFYLSFENSNCRDYITEKFFVTGLQHEVIPIVMGGAPEDYARASPPHSFIHVDDFQSPEELAKYLRMLDENDDLYNAYFRWKGTGSFINTFFWCRICAMLHDTSRASNVYRDLEKWWRGPEVCIGQDSWRQHQRTSKYIVEDYLL